MIETLVTVLTSLTLVLWLVVIVYLLVEVWNA